MNKEQKKISTYTEEKVTNHRREKALTDVTVPPYKRKM